ncbi:MAG: CaiB/BaiF CoA transferase family protein [Bryobacteraceae bacterium]
MLPLEGILVLDFTRAVAGPFCTMTLGDLGARVIKVEEPDGGDETRRWGPPFVGGESAYFLGINRNKESLALDLKSPEGLEAARMLARRADVVVENFRPGVMSRLGLGYAELAAENAGLVYASVSGFGQSGPDRLKPGYDLIMQAMSGLMVVSGWPGQPAKAGFPVADILTSMFAGQAILAALFSRTRDGRGRYVEVALLEGMLAAMCSVAPSYLLAGVEPPPMGTGQANIVPYQLFDCADGQVMCGAPNDRIWERFCEALERPEWLADERYRGNRARVRHRAELVAAVEETMRARPVAQWLERLESHGVPCGPVLTIGQVLNHPQVVARGVVVETEHPELGRLRMVGSPMRFDGEPPRYSPPPRLGEHTQKIMDGLK